MYKMETFPGKVICNMHTISVNIYKKQTNCSEFTNLKLRQKYNDKIKYWNTAMVFRELRINFV